MSDQSDNAALKTVIQRLEARLRRALNERDTARRELAGTKAHLESLTAEHDTASREARRARLEKTRELETMLNSSREMIAYKDGQGRYIRVNRQFERLTGCHAHDAIGKTFAEMFPESERFISEDDANVIATGEPLRETVRDLVIHGETKTFRFDRVPKLNQNGEVNGVIVFAEDITELKRVEQKALEAEKAKEEFLRNMFHELRTPLNAIIGLSELFIMDEPLTEPQKENMNFILDSGKRLYTLIDQILGYKRLDAHKLPLRETPFSLTSLINDLGKHAEILLFKQNKTRDIQFKAETAAEVSPLIIGDPARFNEILEALIDNAIKFTRRGWVHLSVQARGDTLHFLITDTGVGVPEDCKEKVFELFYQVDSSFTREFGGTGIGLTYAKRLAEAMSGTISLDSKIGAGTTITLTLPYHPAPQQETSLGNAPKTRPDGKPTRKGLALVVEDNDINRLVVSRVMHGAGYQVVEARNGQEALSLFDENARQNKQFDIILMDIQMPIMDGARCAQAIRETEKQLGLSPAAIMAISAFTDTGDRQQFLAQGFDSYLAKPFHQVQLIEAISDMLRQQRRPRD